MSEPRATAHEEAISPETICALEGIDVVLAGRQILHGVSFSIQAGDFTGLIGTNGAGKTTLLRVILGLQAPSAGCLVLARDGANKANRLFGYVPQKVLFDPDMPLRARDLVALGLDGHRLGVPFNTARRRALVEEMLEAVDATNLRDARVGEVSGGEQQRVLIAHTLIGGPKLLLLDEPLANLDIGNEQDVVALLSRISSRQGVAILISAHDMNPLLPVMNRIVYLAGGRAASGPTREVVRPEVLSALYGHHVDVLNVHDRVIVVAGAQVGPEVPIVLHGDVVSMS